MNLSAAIYPGDTDVVKLPVIDLIQKEKLEHRPMAWVASISICDKVHTCPGKRQVSSKFLELATRSKSISMAKH